MEINRPYGIEAARLDELCASIGDLLVRTLPRLFGISEKEAELTVFDAISAYIASAPPDSDASKWIAAAACTQALGLQRARIPAAAPPADPRDAEAEVARQILYARGLHRLTSREREALALRVAERQTYWAIAAAMDITPTYAKKLVRRAAEKLRRYARGEE